MSSLSESLLIISIIMLALSFMSCVVRIFFQRDVLVKSEGIRLFQAVMGSLCIAFLCVMCGFIYAKVPYSKWLSIVVFIFSFVITLIIGWLFSHLDTVEDRTIEILETLIGVVEIGDLNLDGHTLHVQKLSLLLYDYLPLNMRIRVNRENLRYASLFVDVGKLVIPREILDKSGKLTSEEWDLVRRHPEIGANVLKTCTSFYSIADWILYHHERVDGSGYFHKKGNEIPLASRIIAVADTFSALTMDRSYKPSLSIEEAFSEMRLVAGTQLDEELVKIFCSIPLRKLAACADSVKKEVNKYRGENFK